MAGAGMRDIKHRIKSIESTKQITKAMELVASSKLRKAKERAQASRPFFNTLYETICDIASSNNDFSSIYTRQRKVRSSLYIVIAGDRGLAGGYNSNVFRFAETEMMRAQEQGQDIQVIAIGTKAVEYFSRTGRTILGSYPNFAEDMRTSSALGIAQLAAKAFREETVDEVYMVYTEFVSALTQEVHALQILPLSDSISGGGQPSSYVIYEPSPLEVFDNIVPKYMTGLIYCAVLESYASEQGARRTAMEAASDNADEMIQNLSLSYNRARQAAITQELTEIIGGASAAE